jgi:hypothetical protein
MERTFRLMFVLLLGIFALGGCKRHGYCDEGDCVCEKGQRCEFECDAPPCHVDCEGDNPECFGECANGSCSCGPGSDCEFTCKAEPCHVACEDSSCDGECGNGDCTCERGSDCSFSCKSGPCHVVCEGENKRCDGQCANGSCSCGPDSTCFFECTDANCSFLCEAGSACSATCPGGTPGAQGCQFTQCAAGAATVCPDGETIVCGVPCPGAD